MQIACNRKETKVPKCSKHMRKQKSLLDSLPEGSSTARAPQQLLAHARDRAPHRHPKVLQQIKTIAINEACNLSQKMVIIFWNNGSACHKMGTLTSPSYHKAIRNL
jgi:hypothetical protein